MLSAKKSKWPNHAIVTCAERLSAIYWERIVIKTVMAAVLFFGFAFLGVWLRVSWLAPVGVVLVAGFFVVPHILRIHHFLTSLPCPACGLPAGSYTSTNSRVCLHCKHCGHEAPTD